MDLTKKIVISQHQQFLDVYNAICDQVAAGTMEVVDGELQWDDIVNVTVRVKATGANWRLVCNTYHGRGGFWEPLPFVETAITFHRGGRVQLPTGAGYAPHFVVTGDSVWLGVRFLDFSTDARFDEPCRVRAELLYPDKVDYSGLKAGTTFAVHEGQKIVATGRVLGES